MLQTLHCVNIRLDSLSSAVYQKQTKNTIKSSLTRLVNSNMTFGTTIFFMQWFKTTWLQQLAAIDPAGPNQHKGKQVKNSQHNFVL